MEISSEIYYFVFFQVLAFIVILISGLLWAIKRGAREEYLIFESVPPFSFGLIIYYSILFFLGVIISCGIASVRNCWMVYIGLALCSSLLAGLAPDASFYLKKR